MPGEDFFGNFMKGVDGLIKARNHIGAANDNRDLSQAEREAQAAMHNLHMYFGRLSFWLTEASDETRRRLARGEEAPVIKASDKVLVIDHDGVQAVDVQPEEAIVNHFETEEIPKDAEKTPEPTQNEPKTEEPVTEVAPAPKPESTQNKPKSTRRKSKSTHKKPKSTKKAE